MGGATSLGGRRTEAWADLAAQTEVGGSDSTGQDPLVLWGPSVVHPLVRVGDLP